MTVSEWCSAARDLYAKLADPAAALTALAADLPAVSDPGELADLLALLDALRVDEGHPTPLVGPTERFGESVKQTADPAATAFGGLLLAARTAAWAAADVPGQTLLIRTADLSDVRTCQYHAAAPWPVAVVPLAGIPTGHPIRGRLPDPLPLLGSLPVVALGPARPTGQEGVTGPRAVYPLSTALALTRKWAAAQQADRERLAAEDRALLDRAVARDRADPRQEVRQLRAKVARLESQLATSTPTETHRP